QSKAIALIALLGLHGLKGARVECIAQVDSVAILGGIAAFESRPDQEDDNKLGFRWSLTAQCLISYCFTCAIL
ncbi:hypothetical protein OFO30_38070, partial [Escherichia coli]|nr:hypothetical protein [Escherichia coli]